MPSSSNSHFLYLADRIDAMDHALTVKELAPLLSVSPTSLYNRAREGRIPSYRIGGCVRFDPHAVAEYLRCQEVKAA
jgi:excisionase family DNA binding protein